MATPYCPGGGWDTPEVLPRDQSRGAESASGGETQVQIATPDIVAAPLEPGTSGKRPPALALQPVPFSTQGPTTASPSQHSTPVEHVSQRLTMADVAAQADQVAAAAALAPSHDSQHHRAAAPAAAQQQQQQQPAHGVPLDAVRKPLTCQLCGDLVSASLVMQCSHVFCGACLYQHLNVKPQCPTCQVQLRAIPVRCLALDAIAAVYVRTLGPSEQATYVARTEEGKAAANKLNKMFWWLQSPMAVSGPEAVGGAGGPHLSPQVSGGGAPSIAGGRHLPGMAGPSPYMPPLNPAAAAAAVLGGMGTGQAGPGGLPGSVYGTRGNQPGGVRGVPPAPGMLSPMYHQLGAQQAKPGPGSWGQGPDHGCGIAASVGGGGGGGGSGGSVLMGGGHHSRQNSDGSGAPPPPQPLFQPSPGLMRSQPNAPYYSGHGPPQQQLQHQQSGGSGPGRRSFGSGESAAGLLHHAGLPFVPQAFAMGPCTPFGPHDPGSGGMFAPHPHQALHPPYLGGGPAPALPPGTLAALAELQKQYGSGSAGLLYDEMGRVPGGMPDPVAMHHLLQQMYLNGGGSGCG